MKIRLGDGAVRDVSESYGLRMITQGRAVSAGPKISKQSNVAKPEILPETAKRASGGRKDAEKIGGEENGA